MKKVFGILKLPFKLLAKLLKVFGKLLKIVLKLPIKLLKGIFSIPKKLFKGASKKKKILLIVLILLLLAALVVVGRSVVPTLQGERPQKLPESYFSGDLSVAALTPGEDLPEDEVWVCTVAEPEEGETAAVYTYTGIAAPGPAVKTYAASLVESSGFSVVDDEFYLSEEPDYTAPEGVVRLAAASEEKEGTLRLLMIEWEEEGCTITADTVEGAINERESLSLTEAVDYMYTMTPQQLGLSGDQKMADYQIYVSDGIVLVDGKPCMRVNIYSTNNPEKTNDVAGRYLMTSDGAHIYRIEEGSGEVEEIDLYG